MAIGKVTESFQYRGYGALSAYPKWFRALEWFEAQLYSTHADVLVGGAITRCELGDWISLDDQGALGVIPAKDYQAQAQGQGSRGKFKE